MTLDEGDEILVDYDGIQYVYKVREKVEVQPEDVFILQQKLNNRELKLITCVPEGTYLRRGVVIAELVDLNTVVGG
jgi:sortase A